MNKKIIFEDWETLEYLVAYERQLEYFNRNVEQKKSGKQTYNRVFFVEHPHVYTLGKHGNEANLIVSEEFLKKIDASFVKTDRGGDITYHGYGQIVVYPVLDLANFNLHVKKYVELLEETIIKTMEEFGINADRLEKAPGIWLTNRTIPEKICAIGVKVSNDITMHGIALNVNTNLDYFNHINPCGFVDKGVTSMKKELGKDIDIDIVKDRIKENFQKTFNKSIIKSN